MTILVTGATGFVGSHIARQLLARGESVRLLVRSQQKALEIFGQNDDRLELVRGDITDRDAVRNALTGCSAVIHAAAGTPLSGLSAEELFAVNEGGTRNVVGSALEQCIDRIIYISSITAIFDSDATKVTPEAEPKSSRLPYGRSKYAAELYLREQQAAGASIAILYPGGVIGPDDPGFSDSCRAIQHRVLNENHIFSEAGVEGGMQYIDVRDLAAFACSLAEEGGSGRYLVPGVYSSWSAQADAIESLAGCTLKRVPTAGWKLRLAGRVTDLMRMFKTIDSPISTETMIYATLWPNIPNTDELGRRGIQLRSMQESFDDTLQWMVSKGHLSAAQCPRYGVTSD